MDKKALQSYAVWAKVNLENQIEVQLKTLGINSERDIKTARKVGDRTIIDGDSNSYPGDLKEKRDQIIRLVQEDGYKQVIEEFAYTWFNRIVALRFMEVHDFLPHGFRVLSSRTGGFEPEIMKNLNFVKDELKLDLSIVAPLMEQGKIDEAYRYVLFRQCNALSGILPMLFSSEQSYLELLLPKALLKGETFITKLLEIEEVNFLDDVEVIGWLYQFYVASDRQEYRDAKVVTKDLIPTLTQVFTPDWIVRYMAENSVGRIWMESYPNSALKQEMKYYVEDAEQEAEVQRKLDEVKYKNVNPEEIKIIEPCCGSGHILVYVFDLLYKMYEEKGYPAREIPTLILKKNLTGLEIDKRAAQLASFSLIMKARSVNSRFFNDSYYVAPEVYEIWDARALLHCDYLNQIRETKLLNNQQIKDIEWLTETFRYGKTIGSLLIVENKNFNSISESINKLENETVINIFNSNFLTEGIKCLRHLLRQAEVMSSKYDVLITNPPYLGIGKITGYSKTYLQSKYSFAKTDMFGMFMNTEFVKNNGFTAIVNPDSWMFIVSFKQLREIMLDCYSMCSMLHLGLGSFDAVVQTTTCVYRKCNINQRAKYYRLFDCLDKEALFISANLIYEKNRDAFKHIPSCPIAYWATDKTIKAFSNKKIGDDYLVRNGISTGDNDRYLRLWFEVDLTKDYWKKCNKGGPYRKWYGNNEYVVFWKEDGYAIKNSLDEKGRIKARLGGVEHSFEPGLEMSRVTSGKLGFRYCEGGFVYESTTNDVFYSGKGPGLMALLGYCNSVASISFLNLLNPTINIMPEDLRSIPYKISSAKIEEFECVVNENVNICKTDWDSFEVSWDFAKHPMLIGANIENAFENWKEKCEFRIKKLRENEELLNKEVLDSLDLLDEYSFSVSMDDITLNKADIAREIKSLISYLIGIEMGRYSLDVEGLAYAGGEWNPMNYVTHQPDDDGIIPVYPQLGMADGLTGRIVKLIKKIYGEDTYKENIDFIADALGKKNNESSEETLNRYLNDGFYADHVKTYQKRPIYWMFSSGKNGAFKCLVYLHRYNEDTLARINSKYFLNESARLNAEVNDTAAQLEAADGREKLRLDKVHKTLVAKQKEMLEYGWVLDHMANQYIPLDLDDGVKVNYAKFQGIEIVNDNGAKVKKDLLVPIK